MILQTETFNVIPGDLTNDAWESMKLGWSASRGVDVANTSSLSSNSSLLSVPPNARAKKPSTYALSSGAHLSIHPAGLIEASETYCCESHRKAVWSSDIAWVRAPLCRGCNCCSSLQIGTQGRVVLQVPVMISGADRAAEAILPYMLQRDAIGSVPAIFDTGSKCAVRSRLSVNSDFTRIQEDSCCLSDLTLMRTSDIPYVCAYV